MLEASQEEDEQDEKEGEENTRDEVRRWWFVRSEIAVALALVRDFRLDCDELISGLYVVVWFGAGCGMICIGR